MSIEQMVMSSRKKKGRGRPCAKPRCIDASDANHAPWVRCHHIVGVGPHCMCYDRRALMTQELLGRVPATQEVHGSTQELTE
jgi:hypothetical protein